MLPSGSQFFGKTHGMARFHRRMYKFDRIIPLFIIELYSKFMWKKREGKRGEMEGKKGARLSSRPHIYLYAYISFVRMRTKQFRPEPPSPDGCPSRTQPPFSSLSPSMDRPSPRTTVSLGFRYVVKGFKKRKSGSMRAMIVSDTFFRVIRVQVEWEQKTKVHGKKGQQFVGQSIL